MIRTELFLLCNEAHSFLRRLDFACAEGVISDKPTGRLSNCTLSETSDFSGTKGEVF
jgi:hypothetical protein